MNVMSYFILPFFIFCSCQDGELDTNWSTDLVFVSTVDILGLICILCLPGSFYLVGFGPSVSCLQLTTFHRLISFYHIYISISNSRAYHPYRSFYSQVFFYWFNPCDFPSFFMFFCCLYCLIFYAFFFWCVVEFISKFITFFTD